MALSESSPTFNNKINLGESGLLDYINKSVYEEIKQEQETNEILNHLRMKYLPHSVRNNSFNKSVSMTYLNRNNSNKTFSPFMDKYSHLDNNNFPKTTHASFDKFHLYNNKVNLKSYKEEKMIPYSLFEQKDSYNLEESKNLNKDNINKEYENKDIKHSNKDNKYKENYLQEENENLRKMNDSYRLLISLLIEYINDISNYFGQNTFDNNYINKILKANNYQIDHASINKLKLRLNTIKNNIISDNMLKKSQTAPVTNIDKIIFKQKNEPIIKDKNDKNYEYKPIIFERNRQSIENFSKSVDRGGIIKKSRTWFDRLPKTYWSLNKKIKFRESEMYKI